MLDKSGNWIDRMRELAALNADFRVVVLFENEKCGADAFRVTWRLLAAIKRGTRVDVRLWQCETMKDEGNWKQLHSDLADATAIIIAAKDDTALRSHSDNGSEAFPPKQRTASWLSPCSNEAFPFSSRHSPLDKNTPCETVSN